MNSPVLNSDIEFSVITSKAIGIEMYERHHLRRVEVRERERKRTTMCSVHHTQHAIESAIQITGSSSLIRKRVIEGET